MRAFMVDRIKDIGLDGANKIIAELGLVVIGARSPSEAIGAVRRSSARSLARSRPNDRSHRARPPLRDRVAERNSRRRRSCRA
jgi:hypothetical protein